MKDDGLHAYAPRHTGTKTEQVVDLLKRGVAVEVDRVGGPQVGDTHQTMPRIYMHGSRDYHDFGPRVHDYLVKGGE